MLDFVCYVSKRKQLMDSTLLIYTKINLHIRVYHDVLKKHS